MRPKWIVPFFLVVAALSLSAGATKNKHLLRKRFQAILSAVESTPELIPILRDQYGATVLHYACALADSNYFNKVIDVFENPGLSDHGSKTPLHLAARSGFYDAALSLLQKGADIYLRDAKGNFPAHYAAESKDTRVLEHLVKKLNFPISSINSKKQTILHMALRAGHANTVRFIVQVLNAYTNPRDKNGMTPLHYAVLNADPEMVEILLSNPCTLLNLQDSEKRTPYAMAKELGRHEIAETLKRLGGRDIKSVYEIPSAIELISLREFALMRCAFLQEEKSPRCMDQNAERVVIEVEDSSSEEEISSDHMDTNGHK